MGFLGMEAAEDCRQGGLGGRFFTFRRCRLIWRKKLKIRDILHVSNMNNMFSIFG